MVKGKFHGGERLKAKNNKAGLESPFLPEKSASLTSTKEKIMDRKRGSEWGVGAIEECKGEEEKKNNRQSESRAER